MSSSGRRSAVSNKTAGNGSRPGSSNKRTPASSQRPGSSSNRLGSSSKTGLEHGLRNKSNSAAVSEKRKQPENDRRITPNKIDGKIKVLGQDAELTETEIWNMNGVSSGKSTPLSSRSSTFRTPTPSKQISLQAVRRKEERDEPLETIDWNDFNRPATEIENRSESMLDDRIPTPDLTDSDDSDVDSAMTMEDRLQLVEKHAQDMTSALSSHPLNDMEENLSKQLEMVEIEREKQDKMERQRQDMGVILNKERQNNENFREFGPVGARGVISDSEIVGANSQTGGLSVNPGASMDLDKGPSSGVNYTVGARPKEIKGDNGSQKKVEAAEQKSLQVDDAGSTSGQKENRVEEDSTSDEEEEDDDEDENDLIGRKGKAPNELLMEFLDCMMKEEYVTAEKLCKMILIYEPNNPEALNFYPLIQLKIQQEEEEEDESDSESDSDDDDDDDDDDNDDDDDEDDDDDDDEDEDEK